MYELITYLPRVAFIGSWSFAIVEFILAQALFIPILKLGIQVNKQTFSLDTNEFPLFNLTFKMTEGKFKATANTVYFTTRLSFTNFFRFHTPFPIKGSAKFIDNSNLEVTARFPLGTSLFFIFWFAGLTMGVSTEIIRGSYITACFIGGIGWGLGFLIIYSSYKTEIYRWRIMTEELISKINGA